MSIPALPPRNPTRLGKLRAAWISKTQHGTEDAWQQILFGIPNNQLSFKKRMALAARGKFLYDHSVPANVSEWAMFQSLDLLIRLKYPTSESLVDSDEEKRERAHLIKGLWETFEMALACGMNPNRQHTNNYYDYPVHKIAAAGNRDLMDMLIRYGANIDQRDGNGYTAMGCALTGWGEVKGSTKEREATSRLLIEKGSDLCIGKRGSHYWPSGEKYHTEIPAGVLANSFPDLQLEMIKKGSPVQWNIPHHHLDHILFIPGEGKNCTRQHLLFDDENMMWDWDNETRLMSWLREMGKTSGPLSDLRSVRGWTPSMELLTSLPVLNVDPNKKLEDQPLIERLKKLERAGVVVMTDKTVEGSNIWHVLFSCVKNHSVELAQMILDEYPQTSELLDQANGKGVKPRHILDYQLNRTGSNVIRVGKEEVVCDLPLYGPSWDGIVGQLLAITQRKELMDIAAKVRPQETVAHTAPKPKM